MSSKTESKTSPLTGMSRRKALRILSTAPAIPLFHPGASPSWKPEFLEPHELETVASLSECILTTSEASGRRVVAVHEYIDLALDRSDARVQGQFRDGLAWFDGHLSRNGKGRFVDLSRQEQLHLLEAISDTSRAHEPKGYAFFTQIKQLTIEGYYREQ